LTRFTFQEKLARALLPHAARLAGSLHARFFTRGLALSLLQRKPDEWRRLHATPSSSGGAATVASTSADNTTRSKTTVQSVATATASLTEKDYDDGHEGEEGESSPAKERKKRKRKRGDAADEIDALFDDVIGRKIVRVALDPVPELASVSSPPKAKTKAREGEGHSKERQRQADLGAVVDAIRVAPSGEGKKKSKRRHV
jgi:hypothetical protein